MSGRCLWFARDENVVPVFRYQLCPAVDGDCGVAMFGMSCEERSALGGVECLAELAFGQDKFPGGFGSWRWLGLGRAGARGARSTPTSCARSPLSREVAAMQSLEFLGSTWNFLRFS